MLLFIFINLYLIQCLALADYCEFGTCNEDQYCCGENKCCKKTVDVWYFWAGVFLIVIVVLFTACLFIKRRQRQKYNPYIPLHQDEKVPNL